MTAQPMVYAYCLQGSDAPALPAELTGIENLPVSTLAFGALRAAVSLLPPGPAQEAFLGDFTHDLPWLSANARAHDAVVMSAFARGPVAPLRFGTLFRSVPSARDALAAQEPGVLAELARLGHSREWVAKVLAPAVAPTTPHPDPAPSGKPAPGDGAAYLRARKAARAHLDTRREREQSLAMAVHERLTSVALESRLLRIPPKELSDDDHRVLLNGAYLVDREREQVLYRVADEVDAELASLGAQVGLSGPLPPHHFITITTDIQAVR